MAMSRSWDIQAAKGRTGEIDADGRLIAYRAPLPLSTAGIVLTRISQSRPSDQRSM